MAYVQPIQQKQLDDLTQTGTGAVTTQSGSTTETTGPAANTNASNLTQATSTPGTAPSQFVNFQDLIDANEGATNDYAKNVGQLIGYGETEDALNKNVAAANNQVNSGYTDVSQDTINRALYSPTETNYDGYDTLKSILGGGGYVGPKNANDIYTTAKASVNTLGDKSGSLNDPTALQQYILEKPNAGTTAGGAQLDAALLTNTKGSQQQIADVQKQVGDLQNKYTSSVSETQAAIDAKAAQAAARQKEILGQATGALDNIRSSAQAQADAQNAAEAARVAQAQNAAKTGDFATLQSLIPGLDLGSLSGILGQLKSGAADYSDYLTATGPSYTAGNYVSDADKARYGGIQQLFGIQAPSLALAGQGATTNFNAGGLVNELNNRLAAQRTAEAQEQAQAAAAQARQGTVGMSGGEPSGGGSSVGDGMATGPTSASQGAAGLSGGVTPGVSTAMGAVATALGIPSAPISAAIAAMNAIGNAVGAANAPGSVGAAADGGSNSSDGTSSSTGSGADAAGGIGGSGQGDTDGIGSTAGSGNNGGDDGAGNGDGGGGGGGGKIICTAMNDLYGLPYRENRIWTNYSVRHLTPAHEVGYHKVFLPLVDYGFKQGDGVGNRLVRSALIWIGKSRTSDIKNELAGKPRNPLHKFLRAVVEPALAAIGRWSK